MSDPLNLLIIEDSEDDALLVLLELRRGGFDPTWQRVETADALRAALAENPWDIVISDYRLPGFEAPAALAIVQQSQLNIPFVVVSGTIGELAAVELMKTGAHDYLMKDNLVRLSEVVRRGMREFQMRAERAQAAIALNEAKERLHLAIEGSSIGLWDWSIPTGTVTLNDRWAEMIGYTLEDLATTTIETWQNQVHPDDLSKASQILEQHFAQAVPTYECELRMQHRLGHWVWVLSR
ncbi:MAG TPA: PAS domain-containing protein, partial [Chroococcidiopsis sp.]